MQQERDALVLISRDESWIGRCKQANQFLLLDVVRFASVQDYLKDDKSRPRTLVIDADSLTENAEQQISTLQQTLPKAEILLVIPESQQEAFKTFKTNWQAAKEDWSQSFLPEFFFFQKSLCEFYEISPTDLFPDTMVYFNAYHFLPLNRRYFPLIHENFILSEKKYKRIDGLKSLYLDRRDTALYIQYIEKYFDEYKVGLRKRTRARFFQLLTGWRNFTFQRLFSSRPPATFLGQYADYPIWLNEVLNYWRSAPDPWALIFEISQLSYLKFDNSLFETALACFFSRFLGDDEVERILNAKAELGAISLTVDPLLRKKWLSSYGQELSSEEQKAWSDHFSKFSQQERFKTLDPSVAQDVKNYCDLVIARGTAELQEKFLVHIYWGEIVASVFQKARADEFKKEDLLEEVMVRCKADGLLSEAWLEELRQFLLKGPTQ